MVAGEKWKTLSMSGAVWIGWLILYRLWTAHFTKENPPPQAPLSTHVTVTAYTDSTLIMCDSHSRQATQSSLPLYVTMTVYTLTETVRVHSQHVSVTNYRLVQYTLTVMQSHTVTESESTGTGTVRCQRQRVTHIHTHSQLLNQANQWITLSLITSRHNTAYTKQSRSE